MSKKLAGFTVGAALALALASPASATVYIVSKTPPNSLVIPAGATTLNLDSMTPGSTADTTIDGVGFHFQPDAQVAQGSVTNVYAAPYVYDGNGAPFGNPDGQDTTPFLTTGVGSLTITLPHDVSNFGLLWGSVDTYNTLQFYDGSTLVGTFTGNDILNPANGDQGQSGSVYVDLASTLPFNKIVASSSQYAFELDNLTIGAPEPASLAILAAGLVGLGFMVRRKSGGAMMATPA
jgi:hypothetical protein